MNDETVNDEVECPWCGHVHEDSGEFFDGRYSNDAETECDECGKPIKITRDFDVTYYTSKGTEGE